jgi:hypothetical protein
MVRISLTPVTPVSFLIPVAPHLSGLVTGNVELTAADITTLPRMSAVSVAVRAVQVRLLLRTRISHPPWTGLLLVWVHHQWVVHLVQVLSVQVPLDLDLVSLVSNLVDLPVRTLYLPASAPHRVHMQLRWALNLLPTMACRLQALIAVLRLPFRLLDQVRHHPVLGLPMEVSMLHLIHSRSLVPVSELYHSTTIAAIQQLERTNHRRRVVFGVTHPSRSERCILQRSRSLSFRHILALLGIIFSPFGIGKFFNLFRFNGARAVRRELMGTYLIINTS